MYRRSRIAKSRPQQHDVLRFISLAMLLAMLGERVSAADETKVNYQDHVLPVLRNGCLNCHNSDRMRGGLDLSSYHAAMSGAGGARIVEPGNPDDSKLYKAVAHLEQPWMPRNSDKLPASDIEIIRRWIQSGALETATARPASPDKPAINLTVVAPIGRPTGPVVLPKGMSTRLVVISQRPGPVQSMAANPWAPLLAVGATGQVLLFNTDTLDLVGVLPFPEGDAASVRFSRSGKILLAAGGAGARLGRVVLFDVVDGRRLAEIGEEYDAILTADIRPDQRVVALGGPTRLLKVYSVADGKVLASVRKHTDWVTAVAFSPDGKYLASGDRAGNLFVWDARPTVPLFTLAGHKAGITGVRFRDDGRLLASCSEDGTVRLWNMADGSPLKTITAHADGAEAIDLAHDGRILSAGRDGRVKLWSVDGSPLKTMGPFRDIALRVAFAHDDRRVFAGDFTGEIGCWNAADGRLFGTFSILSKAGGPSTTRPTIASSSSGQPPR